MDKSSGAHASPRLRAGERIQAVNKP